MKKMITAGSYTGTYERSAAAGRYDKSVMQVQPIMMLLFLGIQPRVGNVAVASIGA